ncbi:DsbA family protein [Saccharophagus degradans]|uniref:DSBA-like thioredoxin domain-containing protein n=2 Tax=Saccharophagus degradans TaxID=86304 RepID=A0AAW7X3Y2_9GAMM|nr:hypothetical protein [Saccharophagus degradans]MDO6421257.1 hypothetical protein [Saccharophagus degradans]MDO6605832.1 hypothetical protein [Saccharophagus degradans]
MKAKMHYIFDPLCGWCYAASPLMTALNEYFSSTLEFVFHPGLLFPKPRTIASDFREHIIKNDARIAAVSGVEFGNAYVKRVRTEPILRYHSEIPAAAVLVAFEQAPNLGFSMLEGIQRIHFLQGKDVSNVDTISQLGKSLLGMNKETFSEALIKVQLRLPSIAAAANELMQAVASNGFPTLVLETEGEYRKLDHSSAYGKPSLFVSSLSGLIVPNVKHASQGI